MSDKHTAGNPTANSTTINPSSKGDTMANNQAGTSSANSTTINPNNGETMTLPNVIVNKVNTYLNEQNLEVNEINTVNTFREVLSGNIAISGIGPKRKEAIEAFLIAFDNRTIDEDEVEQQEKVYTPKSAPKSTGVKVTNKEVYAYLTPQGTQSVPAYHRYTGVPQSLIMRQGWMPHSPIFLAAFGFTPICNGGKQETGVIERGETISDFTKRLFPKQDTETRKAWAKKLLACNPALSFGSKIEKTTRVLLPAYSDLNYTVLNYGVAETFGASQKNAARTRAYLPVATTTHSNEILEVNQVVIMPVIYFSNEKELKKFNESLKLKNGRRVQQVDEIARLENGTIIATRWNDGMHWISSDIKKHFNSMLIQGRTFETKGWKELAEIQKVMIKQGSMFEYIDKEFTDCVWGRADFSKCKSFRNYPKANASASKLLARIPSDSKGKQKMVARYRLELTKWYKEFCDKYKAVRKTNTFSKGIYLNAHKGEFSLPENTIGVYATDIKSKNGGDIYRSFLDVVTSTDCHGRVNDGKEYYISMPLEEKAVFTHMANIKPSKTSWGHQFLMWFKSFDNLSNEGKTKMFKSLGIKNDHQAREAWKTLLNRVLEYNRCTNPIAAAKAKALGNLANKASSTVFEEQGLDWFEGTKGLETLSNSFEKIVNDIFKGKGFKPDNNTFIAPNIVQAKKMVKHQVECIKAMPEHLRGNGLHGKVVTGFSGRFPSNNSDNPVEVSFRLNESLDFCIYAIEVIFLQVADVDGDKAAEILKLLLEDLNKLLRKKEIENLDGSTSTVLVETKAYKLQKIWNTLCDLQIEKTINLRTEIEDVCKIEVLKTLKTYAKGCEFEDLLLEAIMYPNQGPVGPVANHIQSIALNGMMTRFLMLILGALLQNIIDSQKSLNDFYWLVSEDECYVNDEGVYVFPHPSKWKKVQQKTIARCLIDNPNDWFPSNKSSGIGFGRSESWRDFSPELLLPVKLKEALKKAAYRYPEDGGDTCIWEYEGQKYATHIEWFRFFKRQSPYIPSIIAMSHWIKFQLGFPQGYSQSKTPWHRDSQGEFVHRWALPYSDEEYCDAGDNSCLGYWYSLVKEWSEENWNVKLDLSDTSDVSFISYKEEEMSEECKEFLKTFYITKDLNAFSSSNVPKHIAKEIVGNFHEALKRFRVKKNVRGMEQVSYWIMDLFDLATFSKKGATANFLKNLPVDIWHGDTVPFGASYHDEKNREARIFGKHMSRRLAGLVQARNQALDEAERKSKNTAIQKMILLDGDIWKAKKATACRLFEFFAAQCLQSACPIWSDQKEKIKDIPKADWQKVYQMLSHEHGDSLHKCESCFRQFLNWTGREKVSLQARRLNSTITWLDRCSRNIDKLKSLGYQGALPDFIQAMNPKVIKTECFTLSEEDVLDYLKDFELGQVDWDSLGKIDMAEIEDFLSDFDF